MRLITAVAAVVLVGFSAGLTLDFPAATNAVAAVAPHPAQITGAAAAEEERDGFNKTCARSVYSKAFSKSVNSDLRAALRSSMFVSSASTSHWHPDLCTVTLATSLSSDYISFLDAAKGRYTSATEYLKSVHTDCGGPVFQVSVRPLCTKKSLTAVFTGSGSPKTTVLPAVPPSNGVSIDVSTGNVSMINLAANDEDSAAVSERGGVLASAAAMAAVAGAVLML